MALRKIKQNPRIKDPAIINVAVRNVESWLSYWFDRQHIPGMTVAIRHEGQLLLNKSWGLANVQTGEKLTPRHVFRVASQSKMLASTAIMLLREKRKLRLDDPISKHLHWINPSGKLGKVTIKQLMGHTSGISRDGGADDFWGQEKFPDTRMFQKQTQKLTPVPQRQRDKTKYSNWGYGILGQIVESVSGKPYNTFIKENIIQPLRLGSTFADSNDPKARIKTFASGHNFLFKGERKLLDAQVSIGALSTAAGLCSTAADMSAYISRQANDDASVLKKSSRKALLSQHFNRTQYDEVWGLGYMRFNAASYSPVGHGGTFHGQRTATFYEPDLRLAMSICLNSEDIGAQELIESAFHCFAFHIKHQDVILAAEKKKSSINGRYEHPRDIADVFETASGIAVIDTSRTDAWVYAEVYKKIKTGEYIIDADTDPGGAGEKIVFKKKGGKQLLKIATASYTRK